MNGKTKGRPEIIHKDAHKVPMKTKSTRANTCPLRIAKGLPETSQFRKKTPCTLCTLHRVVAWMRGETQVLVEKESRGLCSWARCATLFGALLYGSDKM